MALCSGVTSRRAVVAISGLPGSGKSTVAKALAESLGLRYVSIGRIFRRVADELGVDLVELHRIAEGDPTIDMRVDSIALEEAKRGGVVIEGHLAAWVVRGMADVRIYLKADRLARAERVARRDGKSLEEALEEVSRREEMNRRRYLAIYGINVEDLSIFDLVIDTTWLKEEEVVDYVRRYTISALRGRGFCI